MKFVDMVNIKQGSHSVRRFSQGNTLPLVCLPNALNMFAPQTDTSRGPWYYHPSDRSFEGVRLTHQPSPWAGDFSCLCFLPEMDKLVIDPALRWSGFHPEKAVLKPHVMEYYLLRYKTNFKLSPTDTGAIMSIDASLAEGRPLFAIIPFNFDTKIEVDKESRMALGYTCAYTEAPFKDDFKMYFVLHFDCDIVDIATEQVGDKANAVGVYLAKKNYTVRVASSFISVEQAKWNLERELFGKSFEEVEQEAENLWEGLLSRLQIEANEKIKRTFYSCLYRAFVYPNKFYEIAKDGKAYHVVPQTGEIKEGVSYTNNGFWDTYRTVYPFYSIVRPEFINEIVEGYLNIYDDTGVLPRWLTPSEVNYMPGNLIEAVFADASVKNLLTEENARRAYEATVKNSRWVSKDWRVGRKFVNEYECLGYVPYDKCNESVNETLDCAYGDFCISALAEKCNELAVAEEYAKRSKNYANLFDKESGFMRAKDSFGKFREDFDCFAWGRDYTEGSAWQNSFAVPQDYEGLAALYGGKEEFLKKIDELFATPPYYKAVGYPLEIHEMTEMAAVDFGQCAISNQPSFHIPFLYAEFGEKERSYAIVKRMVDEVFSYEDNGYPGDEDNGTMACWYIFAVLGFYPMCPGKTEFTVSGAIVDSAKLVLNERTTELTHKIEGKNKVDYWDILSFD
ncbi:MAG: glycoside hydrolase family 92 protein [Clostridiales bacterium]|nr:glycoside hydrolase family 92 protein [Clostridiales bacterium]